MSPPPTHAYPLQTYGCSKARAQLVQLRFRGFACLLLLGCEVDCFIQLLLCATLGLELCLQLLKLVTQVRILGLKLCHHLRRYRRLFLHRRRLARSMLHTHWRWPLVQLPQLCLPMQSSG